jgi:hypothetical protein
MERICKLRGCNQPIAPYRLTNPRVNKKRECTPAMMRHIEEISRQHRERPRYCARHLRANQAMKQNFGITLIEYMALYQRQGKRCAICRKGFLPVGHSSVTVPGRQTLLVDHDHATGRVRGLLCVNCNLGIGHLRDSAETLKKALVYLEGNNGRV